MPPHSRVAPSPVIGIGTTGELDHYGYTPPDPPKRKRRWLRRTIQVHGALVRVRGLVSPDETVMRLPTAIPVRPC